MSLETFLLSRVMICNVLLFRNANDFQLKNFIYFHKFHYTPFFFFFFFDFYKKTFFNKNVEAEFNQNFKNVLRTFLRLRVD